MPKKQKFGMTIQGTGNIPIDVEHTLDQATARFQTLKDGLPELIKNSKDHYARLGIQDKDERQIVVLISEDMEHVGVLDFGGAAKDDFEHWKMWSGRNAGRKERGEDIEAGYGNGGKAFMVRGAINGSSMCGYISGKLTKFGFANDKADIKRYEIVEYTDVNGNRLIDAKGQTPEEALENELEPFGIGIEDLPAEARKIFSTRKAFTLVQLTGIKDWENYGAHLKQRMAPDLETHIVEHPQSTLTLETCTVWLQLVNLSSIIGPLKILELEPFEGLETIEPIEIPSELIDPRTKAKVSTGPANEKKKLQIQTSKRSLRLSEQLKARNSIRVRNDRNVVSNWSIADLVPIPASSFIYGSLCCPALTAQHLSGSDRSSLVDTPLSRALQAWATEKVSEVATNIQTIQATRRPEEDTGTVSETLKRLRDLMQKYLKPEQQTSGSSGSNAPEGETSPNPNPPPPPPPEYGKFVDEINLEPVFGAIKITSGSNVPILVKCFEKKDGKRLPILRPKLIMHSEPTGLVELVRGNLLNGLIPGTTEIWFEENERGAKSNKILVEVISIEKLEILAPNHILKQGEKIQLDIRAEDTDGVLVSGLFFEAHVSDNHMGKINRQAKFTAGGVKGKITVGIKWGEKENQISTCAIEIGEEKIEPLVSGGNSGIPYILMCGTPAPGREEFPTEQRTHPGGEDYPTIIDFEPIWEDVVWINHTSKEALKVRSRGSRPLGVKTKTFQEFIALKCFEVLKRLIVREQTGDEKKTTTEFIEAMSRAEMEASDFLDAAYDLVEELTNKDSPIEE